MSPVSATRHTPAILSPVGVAEPLPTPDTTYHRRCLLGRVRSGRARAGLGWARRGTAWQGEAGMATKRVCSVAGCPQLTDGGRCDDHTRAAEQQRGSAYTRGYDAKWRRTRHRYLSAHPLCCEPDCPQLATDVDHIDGLGPNGPRGHDPTNLRAYCHPHHSQRTARDQPGGYTAMN